jgi:hypothetical protein
VGCFGVYVAGWGAGKRKHEMPQCRPVWLLLTLATGPLFVTITTGRSKR